MSELVSVVIPVYNREKYLEESVRSVLNQTYSNLELILIDDASTDGSWRLIQKLQSEDKRIVVKRLRKNGGVGNAKYEGFAMATGWLIGVLGSDDVFVNDAIEKIVKVHLEHPDAAMVYPSMYLCDENLQVIKRMQYIGALPTDRTYQSVHHGEPFQVMHRFCKKSYYLKTAGYDRNFRKAVDKDIIYKLEEVGKLVYLDEPLIYYRTHGDNISRGTNGWWAFVWEARAKREAYKRRLTGNVPTISQTEWESLLYRGYKEIFIQLAAKRSWQQLVISGFKATGDLSFSVVLKLIYYAVKKSINPMAFNDKN